MVPANEPAAHVVFDLAVEDGRPPVASERAWAVHLGVVIHEPDQLLARAATDLVVQGRQEAGALVYPRVERLNPDDRSTEINSDEDSAGGPVAASTLHAASVNATSDTGVLLAVPTSPPYDRFHDRRAFSECPLCSIGARPRHHVVRCRIDNVLRGTD